MAEADFTFNPPTFYDKPVVIAQMWRVTKGTRIAVCELVNHPSRRGEVRVLIDGETYESRAENDPLVLVEQSDVWRANFEARGWHS